MLYVIQDCITNEFLSAYTLDKDESLKSSKWDGYYDDAQMRAAEFVADVLTFNTRKEATHVIELLKRQFVLNGEAEDQLEFAVRKVKPMQAFELVS
ncbi:hypothetical protein E4H12_08665 [Candidatus Thorarchaeota archaeon]|nr:MAG: hypothetical protein E4H12_08665 [Candidatus Thorarchaeota archaeon]